VSRWTRSELLSLRRERPSRPDDCWCGDRHRDDPSLVTRS